MREDQQTEKIYSVNGTIVYRGFVYTELVKVRTVNVIDQQTNIHALVLNSMGLTKKRLKIRTENG